MITPPISLYGFFLFSPPFLGFSLQKKRGCPRLLGSLKQPLFMSQLFKFYAAFIPAVYLICKYHAISQSEVYLFYQ